MKKTLGTILLSILMSTSAAAAGADSNGETSKVERKVVRVVVKENNIKANYQKTDSRHLTRVYGAQTAAAKVIKPEKKKGGMPNLFKN